jgi:uncharacterized BrkB/YihY/UPF0761 family membrane protein
MQTVIKVLGIIALIWIGFIVVGALFKFLLWAVLIGAVLLVGAAAYATVKGKPDRKALR